MKTHKLKILPEYFKLSKGTKKPWEIRKNDRDFKKGDLLLLQEFDGENYTGKEITKQITYVFKGVGKYGLKKGYCILSLKGVKKQSKKTLLKDAIMIDKYVEIAQAFQSLFIKNLQEKGAPTTHQENATIEGYVTPIRLLIERDGAKTESIRIVFKYLQSPQGDFWKSNILSTSKLREKFPHLVIQAQQAIKNNNGNRNRNITETDSDLKRQAGNAVDSMFDS